MSSTNLNKETRALPTTPGPRPFRSFRPAPTQFTNQPSTSSINSRNDSQTNLEFDSPQYQYQKQYPQPSLSSTLNINSQLSPSVVAAINTAALKQMNEHQLSTNTKAKEAVELLISYAKQISQNKQSLIPKSKFMGSRNGLSNNKLNIPQDFISGLFVQYSHSPSWINDFTAEGGIQATVSLLTEVQALSLLGNELMTQWENDILQFILKIAGANDYPDLISTNFVDLITKSIDSPSLSARTLTVDYLLVVLTSDAKPLDKTTPNYLLASSSLHNHIYDDNHKSFFAKTVHLIYQLMNSRGTFGGVVGSKYVDLSIDGLIFPQKRKELIQKEITDFLTSSITLLRLVIELITDLETRVQFRQAMLDAGFGKVLDGIHTWAKSEFPEITSQISRFEEKMKQDQRELAVSSPLLAGINTSEPLELLIGIIDSFDDKEIGKKFTANILYPLLLSSGIYDEKNKEKLFRCITAITSQLVFNSTNNFNDNSSAHLSITEISGRISDDLILENSYLREELAATRERVHNKTGSMDNDIRVKDVLIKELESNIEQLSQSYSEEVANHKKDLYDIMKAWKSGALADGSKVVSVTEFNAQQELLKQSTKLNNSLSTNEISSNENNNLINENITNIETKNENTESVVTTDGIPPPPPPPPGMAGANGSAPPPPPPPPMMVKLPKRIKNHNSEVPLKKLQWDKVPDISLEGTVWKDKINFITEDNSSGENVDPLEEELYNNGVFSSLEEVFTQKSLSHANSEISNASFSDSRSSVTSVVSNKPKEINVIDQRRSQNIQISLRNIKGYSQLQIKNAILSADVRTLSESTLSNLLQAYPTDDEAKLLKSIKLNDDFNIKEYGYTEQVMFTLLDIPRCKEKLNMLTFISSCKDKILEISSHLEEIDNAFDIIKESESIPKCLELILVIGNHLNQKNKTIGGIHGFKISTLKKITGTKAVDGSTNLLHFFIDMAVYYYPDMMETVFEELIKISSASKYDFAALCNDLVLIGSNISNIENEIKNHKQHEDDESDVYTDSLQKFMVIIKPIFDKCNDISKDINTKFKFVSKYYCEDPQRITPEIFLCIFKDFQLSCERAAIENKREEEKALAAQRRLELMREREVQRQRRLESEAFALKQIMEKRNQQITENDTEEKDNTSNDNSRKEFLKSPTKSTLSVASSPDKKSYSEIPQSLRNAPEGYYDSDSDSNFEYSDDENEDKQKEKISTENKSNTITNSNTNFNDDKHLEEEEKDLVTDLIKSDNLDRPYPLIKRISSSESILSNYNEKSKAPIINTVSIPSELGYEDSNDMQKLLDINLDKFDLNINFDISLPIDNYNNDDTVLAPRSRAASAVRI